MRRSSEAFIGHIAVRPLWSHISSGLLASRLHRLRLPGPISIVNHLHDSFKHPRRCSEHLYPLLHAVYNSGIYSANKSRYVDPMPDADLLRRQHRKSKQQPN